MKKKILAALSLMLIGAMVFAFASCKGTGTETTTGTGTSGTDTTNTDTTAAATLSELAGIVSSKKLIIGVTRYEPIDFKDGDNWTGFDADVARAVCEKLGVTAEFVEINWNTKIEELNSKTIDCIWNGFTIDEDIAKQITYTQKYMENKQVIVVRSEDASKYTDLASLATAAFTAEDGSAGEKTLKASATLKNAKYVAQETQAKALQEVLSKTSDAAVIDFIMANYLINKTGSNFSGLKILEVTDFAEPEFFGVGFRKNSDLAVKVNSILDGMRTDGTMKTIAEKYGLADALVTD